MKAYELEERPEKAFKILEDTIKITEPISIK